MSMVCLFERLFFKEFTLNIGLGTGPTVKSLLYKKETNLDYTHFYTTSTQIPALA